MDAEKLIEEAGRWARKWRQFAPAQRGERRDEHLRSSEFIDLLCDALERENKRHRDALTDRDALAAANLAANKEIVRLQGERDDAARMGAEAVAVGLEVTKQRDLIAKTARETIEQIAAERDAARAELARLTTPRPIAEAPATGKVRGLWLDDNGKVEREEVVHVSDGYMRDWHDEPFFCPIMGDPTHFLPLPVLP